MRPGAEVEDLWEDSASSAVVPGGREAAAGDSRDGTVKSWPIFLFLAVVFGGPYLIWKLLRSAEGTEEHGGASSICNLSLWKCV